MATGKLSLSADGSKVEGSEVRSSCHREFEHFPGWEVMESQNCSRLAASHDGFFWTGSAVHQMKQLLDGESSSSSKEVTQSVPRSGVFSRSR